MTADANIFPTSGKPDYIEWYECYQDPSKDTWVNGMERLTLSNQEQRDRWDFFYRPIKSLVGRPQRRQIKKINDENKLLEKQIKDQKELILVVGSIGLVLAIICAFYNLYLTFIVLVASGVFCLDTHMHKSKLAKVLYGKKQLVSLLKGEISQLIAQIPDTPSEIQAEHWLDEMYKLSELKALRDITHSPNIDAETIGDYIEHEPISDNGVRGLLIDCWGLLQPQKTRTTYGWEQTGFARVLKDLSGNIATWRTKRNGSPLYRVIYMQHIFLLEKNINVYGFFYDFVTGKRYGKREETFQYGHITNFNINEVEFSEDSLGNDRLGISNALIESLKDATFEAFTLTVSSGVNFRCVLTTETVIESMNDWLELERRHKQIKLLQNQYPENEGVDNEDLTDKRLIEKWGLLSDESLNLEDIEREVVLEKMQLAEREKNMVNKVIQQVRLRVETPPQIEVVQGL